MSILNPDHASNTTMILDPARTAPIRLHTSAPVAYDGFSTTTVRTLNLADRRGNPVREITIERRDYDWQTMRYDSGSHLYTTDRITMSDRLRFGDWVPIGTS